MIEVLSSERRNHPKENAQPVMVAQGTVGKRRGFNTVSCAFDAHNATGSLFLLPNCDKIDLLVQATPCGPGYSWYIVGIEG